MTLTPQIDEFACAAHGDCALAAPDVFAVEDIAVVIGKGNGAVVEAARACPAGAITVIDDETGRQVYP